MYHTTGFAKDEIIDLCALVYANEENSDTDPWPRSLGNASGFKAERLRVGSVPSRAV